MQFSLLGYLWFVTNIPWQFLRFSSLFFFCSNTDTAILSIWFPSLITCICRSFDDGEKRNKESCRGSRRSVLIYFAAQGGFSGRSVSYFPKLTKGWRCHRNNGRKNRDRINGKMGRGHPSRRKDRHHIDVWTDGRIRRGGHRRRWRLISCNDETTKSRWI